jgi:esterase/lipase
MKKKILLAIVFLLVIFFISLPLTRYRLGEKINPLNLPTSVADLDSYLAQSESKFSDVVTGAEKKIVWASAKQEQTEYAIVYVHGYSASRQEIAPLADLVAKDLKANLFYTRLTGHARNPEAFANSSANDWLNDSVEALEIGKKIGKKVILMGTSTGSALILWLVNQEQYQKDVASIIFISPNFYPVNKMTKLFLYPAGVGFAKIVYGKERSWEPRNAQEGKYWNHKYRWEAIAPMIVLVEHIQNISYAKINVPALFLYTQQDKVVDTSEIVKKFELFGSKDKKLLNLSQCKDHIMAGDILSPDTTPLIRSEIVGFLKNTLMDRKTSWEK